jgi:plasmid stabilization system protein ParE
MDYKVEIYSRAELEFFNTVNYLIDKWTVNDANNFMKLFSLLEVSLAQNPYQYPYYDRRLNIHMVPVTKHNMVYYQIDENRKLVFILTIFNVFQNPDKLRI